MTPKKINTDQLSFFMSFEDTLNQNHPLFILANKVDWPMFDKEFEPLYSKEGRPAKPIRLMVGLLILKHIRNLSDESVVEQWAENNYYQYFCGGTSFRPGVPCEASELVHFRNRIKESGAELIFRESIRINGNDSNEEDIKVDTTVQEKNITFPTDSKLHKKIIKRSKAIVAKENLPIRQSYTQILKQLSFDLRFRNHPKNKWKARKADKKLKTIAGRLVRELERNLPPNSVYQNHLNLYKRVLAQKRDDKNKIYSLHEPNVYCISKGKEHKKYEFGNKVSISVTENTGVIVGVSSFSSNPYDGHTLETVVEQYKDIFGKSPKNITVDRGYKGVSQIGETKINIPKPFNKKKLNTYQQKKLRHRFRRRAAIEPVIGHLKTDYRLSKNFYKGIKGDVFNILFAAAAFNFKRIMNKFKNSFLHFFQTFIFTLNILLQNLIFQNKYKVTF